MKAAAPARVLAQLSGTWWLLALALLLYLVLSPPLLAALGVPYDAPTGSFPVKIHPGSYVLMAACLVAWQGVGFGLGGLQRACREQPLLVGYLACMVASFTWAVARHGPGGLAYFIDTLFMPAVAGLLIARQPEAARMRLLHIVMVMVLVNALLAVIEYAFKAHLVPGVMGAGELYDEDFFRSAALLGHPLTNAKVTVTAMPFLWCLPWTTPWRLSAAVLMSLALLAFGGRTSLAVGGLVYGLVGGVIVLRRLLAGRFTYLQLTGGSVGLLFGGSLVAMAILLSGLGERIFHQFTWDNSADSRLLAWQTLDYFNGLDLWLGLPIDQIEHLAERVGIDLRFGTIENFWVYQLLLLGIIGFVPFVLGIGLIIAHFIKRSTPVLWLAILVYFVVASGTNSLASKTISLLMLSVLVHAAVREKNRQVSPRRQALRIEEAWG